MAEEFIRSDNYIYPKRIITAALFGVPMLSFVVLVVEAAERWGYYGGSAVISLFMKEMYNSPPSVIQLYNNMNQFWCYATCIFAAWIADVYLGQAKTIAYFGLIYIVGIVLQALSSMPFMFADFPNGSGSGGSQILLWMSLFIIGIATGGIKACVGPLMSAQVLNPTDETTTRLFSYYYLMINIGGLGAYGLGPYLHRYEPDEEHPNGTTYYYTFWLTAGVLIVGMVLYWCFLPFYITPKLPKESPITRFCKCVWSAFKNRKDSSDVPHWIHRADGYSESELTDYQRIFGLLAIFVHYPTFWWVYTQSGTYTTVQGTYLDSPSWLTPDQLGIADSLFIVILIPTYDMVIYPLLNRCGVKLNVITKIALGFICMGLAAISMAFIQLVLAQNGTFDGSDYILNPDGNIYSVWWLLIPFFFMANGEVFASVSLNEISYTQAPTTLKSVMFGLGNFTSVGGGLLGIIMAPFQNNDNLTWFWFAFGGLVLLQGLFIKYQFRRYNVRSVEEDLYVLDSSETHGVIDCVEDIGQVTDDTKKKISPEQ